MIGHPGRRESIRGNISAYFKIALSAFDQ